MVPYGLTDKDRQTLVAALSKLDKSHAEIGTVLGRWGMPEQEIASALHWLGEQAEEAIDERMASRDGSLTNYRRWVAKLFLATHGVGGDAGDFSIALAIATHICGATEQLQESVKRTLANGLVEGVYDKKGNGDYYIFRVNHVSALGETVLDQWGDEANMKPTMRVNDEIPRIFVGHGGQSHDWQTLMLRLHKLGLYAVEFGSTSSLARPTTERVEEMLNDTNLGLLVMSAEDLVSSAGEDADDEARTRQNVIHELGFWQGRHGLRRGVMLVEKGVTVPSNLSGIQYIQYEGGNIASAYSELEDYLHQEFPAWTR